jgi:choline kinase
MKGLILAAGRGSRLGPLTRAKHKAEMTVAGDTLVGHALQAFQSIQVNKVALCSGYRHENLSPLFEFEFHNSRWESTNMVASMMEADSWLSSGRTIVAYGDIIFDAEILQSVLNRPGDIVLPINMTWLELWQRRFSQPFEDAETLQFNDAFQLTAIGGRPTSLAEVQGQFMGVLVLSKVGWEQLKKVYFSTPNAEISGIDLTALLSRALKAGVEVSCVPTTGRWAEVDSGHDLQIARNIFEEVPPRR